MKRIARRQRQLRRLPRKKTLPGETICRRARVIARKNRDRVKLSLGGRALGSVGRLGLEQTEERPSGRFRRHHPSLALIARHSRPSMQAAGHVVKKSMREIVPTAATRQLTDGEAVAPCSFYMRTDAPERTKRPQKGGIKERKTIERSNEAPDFDLVTLCIFWAFFDSFLWSPKSLYPRSERSSAAGSSPRSIASTSADATITPSTCGARRATCSRLRMPKPAHTGKGETACTRAK
jgi:hypothetical protein